MSIGGGGGGSIQFVIGNAHSTFMLTYNISFKTIGEFDVFLFCQIYQNCLAVIIVSIIKWYKQCLIPNQIY